MGQESGGDVQGDLRVEDPVCRSVEQKKKAYESHRRWVEKNREKNREYKRNYEHRLTGEAKLARLAKINELAKRKYHTDPVYRQNTIENTRKRRILFIDQIRQQQKQYYRRNKEKLARKAARQKQLRRFFDSGYYAFTCACACTLLGLRPDDLKIMVTVIKDRRDPKLLKSGKYTQKEILCLYYALLENATEFGEGGSRRIDVDGMHEYLLQFWPDRLN